MVKVIGAGFGRTGTHSLGRALELLGFGPCYNLLEISAHPDHNEIWQDAMDGKPVDWDRLFASYNSAVEWPTIAFLPELLEYFPQAKVILTLRDPDSWYKSASETIFDALELSAFNPDPVNRKRSGIKRKLILEETFGSRYNDKGYAIEVYQRHQERVIELVPPDQLLQYHVEEGWAPLCEFLDQPAPDEPFPMLNRRKEFLDSAPEWARKIKQKNR